MCLEMTGAVQAAERLDRLSRTDPVVNLWRLSGADPSSVSDLVTLVELLATARRQLSGNLHEAVRQTRGEIVLACGQ